MAYTEIDMTSYPRKAHFEYFKNMAYPYVGLTVHVDITDLVNTIKQRKLPFFFTALYIIANAANGVPELRRRIKDEVIIEYPHCNTSYTVALDNGTYCYCKLDCSLPFERFLTYAAKAQNDARSTPSIDEAGESDSLFFISCVPWVSFTSIIQPADHPADSNPRITFGRYFMQNDRVLMPVSLLVHHALADGKHIADFYQSLEKACRQFSED